MNWHWGDLALRIIRAAGALAGAVAGIAALLTDGAFVKRERPLSGWWKDYPFGQYRVTRWGGTLLAVILIAPSIQFVGDWIKDANDTKTLENTAEKIRSDIKDAVKAETSHASKEIVSVVQAEANDQLVAQRNLLTQQEAISSRTLELQNGTTQILGGMDRTLYPFKDIKWGYSVRINLQHPQMRQFRDYLRHVAKDIFDEMPYFSGNNKPGFSVFGKTNVKSVEARDVIGKFKELFIHIDSPVIVGVDEAPPFATILGYPVYVDIWKKSPTDLQLTKQTSPEYAVALHPPYSAETYVEAKSDKFPPDSDQTFELNYRLASGQDPDSDRCFVAYYWKEMKEFNAFARPATSSFVGLSDLLGAELTVRVATDLEPFWNYEPHDSKTTPPISLNSIKMRVGSRVLSLSVSEFTRGRRTQNGFLVYRKQLPNSFTKLLGLFDTTPSDDYHY